MRKALQNANFTQDWRAIVILNGMSRTPLAPLNANARVVASEPVKVRVHETDAVTDDSTAWNLRQRIGHLQAAIDETNQYNARLQAEIDRLATVEDDLARQRQINAPLIDAYLRIKEDEEARLFQ